MRLADAHMNGDCWPPLCQYCEREDEQARFEVGDDDDVEEES